MIGLSFIKMESAKMVSKRNCPFCFLSDPSEIFLQNFTFFVKYDNYPVADGHVLIIPKRHVLSFFQLLNESEVLGFYKILKKAQNTLLLKYSPDGFTIGINQGKAARELGISVQGIHRFRSNYAQNLYEDLRKSGKSDREARREVSRRLGHNRVEVTNSYIPHRYKWANRSRKFLYKPGRFLKHLMQYK